ncbi:hypothetical protein RDABS01_027490 [Bienertia sinuspersici]
MPNLAPTSTALSFLVWNVQGAGSKAFIAALREVLIVNKPVVLALVETHMGGEQAQLIATKFGFGGHTRMDANGFAGGIWVYWRAEMVHIRSIEQDSQHITMEVVRNGEIPWYFTAIYANPDPIKRQDLWAHLKKFAENNNHPWMLGGDFNDTRYSWERSSACQETQRRSRIFNNWVENMELLEIEFSGPSHTWARGLTPETRKSARLDRVLCNSAWATRFEHAIVKHLPAIQSDHCPLFITPNGFAPLMNLNRPFRFQAAWMTHENFQEFIHAKWASDNPLVLALKKLANDLQSWNKEVFHNIFRKKRELLARIEGIQKNLSIKHDRGLIKLESKLRKELDEVLYQEELLWYQKSRVNWICDGDRNTSFFHLSTITRRWKNRIVAIKDENGHWLQDQHEIKSHIVNYFDRLYTEESNCSVPVLPRKMFPLFPEHDWKNLNKKYSTNEVYSMLNCIGSLKAPGPDGFQALFFQKNWSLVGPKVSEQVLDILNGKGIPQQLNDTFLALIPKVDAPDSAKQFRPISLCNVIYKLVTKVLVQRIKGVLPSLVSPTQCSYVPGRQITDNIVIFQEVLHSMRTKQGKEAYMAIKIDLEKAYDRLRWSFIHETLSDMRLPKQMVKVIMECISTTKMKVLWNGEPTMEFTPSRGIRQGDPLSPYIFVMCMERLNQVIEESIFLGKWRPIKVNKKGPLLSNLLFADDIVIFAEASVEQAQVIQDCLQRFCDASGEKVSCAKSRVFFSANTEPALQHEICNELNISQTEDLGFYLGMPALHTRVTKATFAHLCEKVDRKLVGWKSKFLSLAGRATLAQSTLSTMALYSMQTAKVPKSICDEIDKKTRRFIWGGDEDHRKIHLISWETMQKPKDQGGLGMKSMRQANAAFLTKLGWRILSEPTTLWSRVVRNKYCNGRCDVDMFKTTSNCSNLWRGVVENAKYIQKGTQTAIGNGTTTLFWDHKWATDQTLSELAIKDVPLNLLGATVAEMWDSNLGWKWDLFAEYLPISILKKIQACEIIQEASCEDTLYWSASHSGRFTIKSALKLIKQPQDNAPDPHWKVIWSANAQNRVKFFLWLVMHNRILCNENRAKRGLTDDLSCSLCGQQVETCIHTLRDCEHARNVWNTLCSIDRKQAFFREENLQQWIIQNLDSDNPLNSELWSMTFSLTLWWIWKWRNQRIFRVEESEPVNKMEFIKCKVEETKSALERDLLTNFSHIRRQELYIRWTPPPYGWIALNTDGASKGCPGPAGAGGILRDYTGKCLRYFSANLGVCTAMRAELMALKKGLLLAREYDVKYLDVRMDNQACTQILSNDEVNFGPNMQLVKQCKQLIARPQWVVTISHCYRESNRAVDWLANEGVTQDENLLVDAHPPPNLARIILDDSYGVAFPRMTLMP